MMKKTLFAVLALTIFLPLKATAANFSKIYAFGDSLSDTVNLYKITGFPPSPPFFEGRFSNGPMWVEYLAEELGARYNPNTAFAFGGATADTRNLVNDDSSLGLTGLDLPGLQQQIELFTNNNPKADSKAIYTISIGNNDYGFYQETDPNQVIANLENGIRELADVGAKTILVTNLPKLANNTIGGVELSDPKIIDSHNKLLNDTLIDLNQELGINTIVVDLDSLYQQVLNNPAAFGFTNVTDGCLLVGCTNPDEFLFWSEVDPTTRANEFIAKTALAELRQVPEPMSGISPLIFALFSLKFIRKKYL